MRKLFLLAFQILLVAPFINAQCPIAGFSMPDTVCAGENYQIINTSTGGVQHYWDFCPGDMQASPQSSLMSSDPLLNYPQQIRVVTDNGNYYLFVANLLSSSLIRYDFGTDIDNVPTLFDYGNVGGLLSQPAGLEVINDNGTWYAFLSNIGTNNLVRVNLGSVLANNSAAATDIGFFGLSVPRGVKIAKDAGNYYAFISTLNGNCLTKIDFGSTLSNNPATFTLLTSPSFDVPWGFDLAFDCSINSWVGFYASNNLSTINVIDFGSTLANTGSVVSSFPCLASPSGIGMTVDDNKWYILVNSFTTSEFQKIQISGDLLSAPTSTQSYVIAQSSNPRNLSILRDSSTFKVFVANNQPSTIGKIEFALPCAVTPPTSVDSAFIPVVFGSVNYYQNIVLEVAGPNGEISYFSDSMYISEAPVPGFFNSDVCGLQPILFTDTSIVSPNFTTTWHWDFGDSNSSTDQNPVHSYTSTGAYNVILTVSYLGGCSISVSDSVYVYGIPSADFIFQDNQCTGIPILFTDQSQVASGSNIISWDWDFGDSSAGSTDQNPIHVYDSAGVYTVELIVGTSGGCSNTISFDITILPAPVSDFTVSSTCIGEIVSFNNNTVIQGGGNINYSWDFGDSFTSGAENPTHQYALSAANYLVTLIATAANSCSDTIVQDIRISNKPVPQFTFSPLVVCKFNQITFINSSFGVGGDTISNYLWDFGDSVTSTDQNPFHAYSDTGFFDVTLTVISPTACDSSVTLQVYVIPSPTASFTASGVCYGTTTSFNPLITTPVGTQVDSVVWEFGDGDTFTGLTSPTHLYTLPGKYGVSMTVYNNLLCTGFYIDSIDVYPIPVADFSSGLSCSGSDITFDGSLSNVTDDSISTWLWNFDGLGTSSDTIAEFTFQNPGIYDITLIVSTVHGCQDTITSAVNVIQSPQFDFIFNEPCLGLPSTFTYIPLINPPPIAVLTWNFGDGTISSQLNPVYIYSYIDTFTVSLTVLQNSTGCSAVIEKPLVIKPLPVAGFEFLNSCEDLPVQFTDTSTIASGSILSHDWNFGIYGSSSLENPIVTPTNAGNYPVTLTVISDEGCVSVTSDTITVFGNPVAAFTPDPLYGSPPLTVNFINNSTGGVSFEWLFGDGETATGTTVNHIYQDTGLYSVEMIATSIDGCIDTANGLVSVLIPYLDVAVNNLYVSEDNNLLTVSAELLNVGNVPVSSFQISANIQNGSIINEAWTGDFQPGNLLLYTFTARYDIASKSVPGYYCVEVDSPNDGVDQNLSNNSKCTVISNLFEVFSVSPNPFTDEMAITLNLPFQGDYEVTIFEMTGKIAYESPVVNGKKGYNKLVIPTLNFSKGIYAVVVRYRDEVKTINALHY